MPWPQPQHFSLALISSSLLISACLSTSFLSVHLCPVLCFSLHSLFFLSPSLSGRSRRCNWLCCCWGFVLRRALIFSFTQNAKWRLEAVRDFTRLPVCVCVCVCLPVSHSALTNCTRSECILIHAPNKLYKVFVWCTVTSLCVCLCVCVNEAILLSPNYSSFLTTVKLLLKTKKSSWWQKYIEVIYLGSLFKIISDNYQMM